jgi:hypothetical protein
MTDLSPAAQAVWTAFLDHSEMDETPADLPALSAALRAAADQVVPEYETTPGGSKIWPSGPVPSIRTELLAIADELDPPSS